MYSGDTTFRPSITRLEHIVESDPDTRRQAMKDHSDRPGEPDGDREPILVQLVAHPVRSPAGDAGPDPVAATDPPPA
jgi:hypothetical protein